ncbi:HlyD family efflux transporter periplasmic adaptor subunit [Oculatella sp. LEGE 06141]|uniref:HlyD family efflux transporter periplasmic adaptor subunit n=1 Tax=Oculatella sp. LEGE 06141 TaxID=1828648 RepID=UPI001881A8F1|nr:HlyD family efflux transporter periplasmic adaptor subunit [Oculatella sp. LEGE 06141]MBE9178959.1 HlyD family efflux transporter periplasmic adaptor subunit [Oculatella sp. LEGE 06141]
MSVSNAQRPWSGRGLWLGLAALILLGFGSVLAFRLVIAPGQNQVEEVAPPPRQVSVAALGRLEPEGEVVNISGSQGDRIGQLLVREGEYVQQGDVLAYLESYGERLAERNYAASQLAEAQTQIVAETEYGSAQVQEARTRLGQIDQPQSFEIQAQQATVRQLEAELSLVQTDLDRYQTLQQEGAISRQELDQQITEVRRVQEELTSARANLIRLEASRSNDLRNAQAQVQSSEANLTRSQAQVQVDSAARNLELANARLDRTIIRAPASGEVLRIYTRAGEAIAEDGILAMGNTRQMYVVAEVYETDVGLVRPGQRATVTSRNGAFDVSLGGTVERIGSQIFKNNVLDDDPAANADARVVEVRIRLDQSEPVAQLTNLQVDVRIDVDDSGTPPANPTPSPTVTP